MERKRIFSRVQEFSSWRKWMCEQKGIISGDLIIFPYQPRQSHEQNMCLHCQPATNPANPTDTQQPIVLGPPEEPDNTEHAALRLDLGERFNGVIIGIYLAYDPKAATSVPSFWRGLRFAHRDVDVEGRLVDGRRDPGAHSLALRVAFRVEWSGVHIIYTLVWILVAPAIKGYSQLEFATQGRKSNFPRKSPKRNIFWPKSGRYQEEFMVKLGAPKGF
ncbi:hypothetical protein C8R44DRAFT_752358 [Mycena epipterygia]|nr:hypothetical protein C8R44DRAFT_752358 [Mycena epipterygia]